MHAPAAALSLLALATQITAKPLAADGLARRVLAHDDVVLLGDDGSSTVMKESEFNQLQARAEVLDKKAALDLISTPQTSRAKARGCDESSEVQVLTDQTFVNWDVPMSGVVSAQGGTSSVSVSDGYSISNTLSVGASSTVGISDFLSVSFSIDYSQTWQSSQSLDYSFTVPDGQFGIVVSQPMVRRLTGNSLSGCTDNPTSTPFTSDSYTSMSSGGLTWVTGLIRLCNSTQYPIPYCIGEGTHA